MRQRVIVAKIAQQASDVVRDYFRRMACRANADGTIPNQYSEDVSRFVKDLRTFSDLPPVLFFSEHLDMWSMGDIVDRRLKASDTGELVQFYTGSCHLACFSLSEVTDVNTQFNGIEPDAAQEERWFFQTLANAIEAWQGFYDRAVIVVIRQITGGTVTDDEVLSLRESVPEWLSRLSSESPAAESR